MVKTIEKLMIDFQTTIHSKVLPFARLIQHALLTPSVNAFHQLPMLNGNFLKVEVTTYF